jgi:hypothetical protein
MRYIRRLPLYDIHILVILIYVYRLLIYDVHNMNVNIYIYICIYIYVDYVNIYIPRSVLFGGQSNYFLFSIPLLFQDKPSL